MGNDEPEKKGGDAFVAWLTKVEQAPKVLDEELTKLIEFLISEKDKFLPKLTSSKEDQEFFDNELERINAVRHSLRLMHETVTDTALKAEIWEVVVSIFIAGINLGQYSEPLNIVNKELQLRKSDNMREAKLKKLAPIIDRRKELLQGQGYDLEVAAKMPKKFYKQFMKVCAEKGIEGVTIKTFQRDAQDILKECLKKLDTL